MWNTSTCYTYFWHEVKNLHVSLTLKAALRLCYVGAEQTFTLGQIESHQQSTSYFTIGTNNHFFIYSPGKDIWVVASFVIINKVAINIHIYFYVSVCCNFSRINILRWDFWVIWYVYVPFRKHCPTVLQSGCTTLHSHHQRKRDTVTQAPPSTAIHLEPFS